MSPSSVAQEGLSIGLRSFPKKLLFTLISGIMKSIKWLVNDNTKNHIVGINAIGIGFGLTALNFREIFLKT